MKKGYIKLIDTDHVKKRKCTAQWLILQIPSKYKYKEKETWYVDEDYVKNIKTSSELLLEKMNNRVGEKHNRLTLTEYLGERMFRAECDCGNEITVNYYHLKSNKSCGCLKSEVSAELLSKVMDQGVKALQDARIDGTNIYSLKQKTSKNSTTGHKGVSRLKSGKYRAYINVSGKQIHLGSFDIIDEAIEARKEAEKTYYKPIIEKHKKKNSKK